MKVDEDETIPEVGWTQLRAPLGARGEALKNINRQYHLMLTICFLSARLLYSFFNTLYRCQHDSFYPPEVSFQKQPQRYYDDMTVSSVSHTGISLVSSCKNIFGSTMLSGANTPVPLICPRVNIKTPSTAGNMVIKSAAAPQP